MLVILSLEALQGKRSRNSQEKEVWCSIRELCQIEGVRVAFKTRGIAEREETRETLLQHGIKYYYSVFYPIHKPCEEWGLYSVDTMLQNIERVVVVETRYSIEHELPLLHSLPVLLIATEHYTSIPKSIAAITHSLRPNTPTSSLQWVLRYEEVDLNAQSLQARVALVMGLQSMRECLRTRKRAMTSNTLNRRVLCEHSADQMQNISHNPPHS